MRKLPHGLWADVPPDRRATEAFLRTRLGSRQSGWVEEVLERCVSDDACRAAVRFNTQAPVYYVRCGIQPQPGERFCHVHGGAKKPPPPPPVRPSLTCLECGRDIHLKRTRGLCNLCVRQLTAFEEMVSHG